MVLDKSSGAEVRSFAGFSKPAGMAIQGDRLIVTEYDDKSQIQVGWGDMGGCIYGHESKFLGEDFTSPRAHKKQNQRVRAIHGSVTGWSLRVPAVYDCSFVP